MGAVDESKPLLPQGSGELHVVINETKPQDDPGSPLLSVPPNIKTYFEVFFVVMPLFSGYACLFALQREVKQVYNIQDDGSADSHLFGIAASFVYVGNLVFRLGHNFFFFFVYPRTRVVISIAAMACSMSIIVIIFSVKSPPLWLVFIAYAFGGMGIGTFESNLLSSVAVLGKNTKLCALLAIPSGIIVITVGGFIVLSLGVHAVWIYVAVLAFLVVGLCLFFVRIYRDAGIGNYVDFRHFLGELKLWRHWLPHIRWHSMALTIDMFFVSMFSPGVLLYIYDSPTVSLPFGYTVSKDWLFAVFDLCFFLGDTISRRLLFPLRIVFPFFFLIASVVGAVIGLSNLAFIVPVCGFLVAFANGSIYAQANKLIDTRVPAKYSLIAFSFWLFLGDIGSVIGSNLISYVNVAIKDLYH